MPPTQSILMNRPVGHPSIPFNTKTGSNVTTRRFDTVAARRAYGNSSAIAKRHLSKAMGRLVEVGIYLPMASEMIAGELAASGIITELQEKDNQIANLSITPLGESVTYLKDADAGEDMRANKPSYDYNDRILGMMKRRISAPRKDDRTDYLGMFNTLREQDSAKQDMTKIMGQYHEALGITDPEKKKDDPMNLERDGGRDGGGKRDAPEGGGEAPETQGPTKKTKTEQVLAAEFGGNVPDYLDPQYQDKKAPSAPALNGVAPGNNPNSGSYTGKEPLIEGGESPVGVDGEGMKPQSKKEQKRFRKQKNQTVNRGVNISGVSEKSADSLVLKPKVTFGFNLPSVPPVQVTPSVVNATGNTNSQLGGVQSAFNFTNNKAQNTTQRESLVGPKQGTSFLGIDAEELGDTFVPLNTLNDRDYSIAASSSVNVRNTRVPTEPDSRLKKEYSGRNLTAFTSSSSTDAGNEKRAATTTPNQSRVSYSQNYVKVPETITPDAVTDAEDTLKDIINIHGNTPHNEGKISEVADRYSMHGLSRDREYNERMYAMFMGDFSKLEVTDPEYAAYANLYAEHLSKSVQRYNLGPYAIEIAKKYRAHGKYKQKK